MSALGIVGNLVGTYFGGSAGGQIGKMAGELGSSVISSGSKTANAPSGGGGGGGAASAATSVQTALFSSQQARLRAEEEKRAGFVTKPRAQIESVHGTVAPPSIAAKVIASIAADNKGEAALNSLRNNMFQRQLSAMEAPLRNV